ncbi:hypothetical protein YPPY101_1476, partial [Yersinia pestis PY-101]
MWAEAMTLSCGSGS